MLVLWRRNGEWCEIVHRSGDVLRIRVYAMKPEGGGHCNLAFLDDDQNFQIDRSEFVGGGPFAPGRTEPPPFQEPV